MSTLPQEVKQTIRFWLDYWKKNHRVIFEGDFEPMQVSRFYPVIKIENEQKSIYMLYEDYSVNLPVVLNSTMDVINSKTTGNIHFLLSKSGMEYNYEIFNCQGKSTEKGIIKSKNKNFLDFSVPVAGFIRVSPIQLQTGL